jgi:hypothetical protein
MPGLIAEDGMTIEDPWHALIAGQVSAHAAPAQWDAVSYRCPCGFATGDASEFDQHLDGAEGAEPEHFEVLDGWTLQQVRQWQAATTMPDGEGTSGRAARAS